MAQQTFPTSTLVAGAALLLLVFLYMSRTQECNRLRIALEEVQADRTQLLGKVAETEQAFSGCVRVKKAAAEQCESAKTELQAIANRVPNLETEKAQVEGQLKAAKAKVEELDAQVKQCAKNLEQQNSAATQVAAELKKLKEEREAEKREAEKREAEKREAEKTKAAETKSTAAEQKSEAVEKTEAKDAAAPLAASQA